MRLRINKHFSSVLANEYLPHMVQFAQARQRTFTAGTDEEMNIRIIAEVLKGLQIKFAIKVIVCTGDYCFLRLTEAETCTLYQYLLKYPIMLNKEFELQQRDYFIHLLHKYLNSPVPSQKILQLYR